MTSSSSSFESPVDSAIAGAASRGDRLRAIREYAPTGQTRGARGDSLSDDEGVSDLAGRMAAVGGLSGSRAVPVTHGECVIVVHEDVDNSSDCTLCGVEIGQSGKLCFKEGCSTNAHVQARKEPTFWLKQGIYIRSGTSGAPMKKVYSSPVGSLDIFDIHREEILGIADTTPALWATRFNTWEQSSDPEEAAHLFSVKARAKHLQTPSKPGRPQIDFSEFFQSMAPTELMGDMLEDHMWMYESLWRKTGDEKDNQLLPSNFDFGEHIVENHQRLGHMSGITASLTEEQGADKRWTERELQGSALRITDLEKIVGEPVGDSASI